MRRNRPEIRVKFGVVLLDGHNLQIVIVDKIYFFNNESQ
jgi:hypothetical protein